MLARQNFEGLSIFVLKPSHSQRNATKSKKSGFQAAAMMPVLFADFPRTPFSKSIVCFL